MRIRTAARSRPPSSARWVALAGLVGFASAAVFSSLLQWERSALVLAHTAVTLVFVGLYVVRTGVDPVAEVRRRWPAGLTVGLVGGAVLAYGVRQQVTSASPSGSSLVGAVVWFGLLYGSVDALLLSVVPIRIMQGSRPTAASAPTRLRREGAYVVSVADGPR